MGERLMAFIIRGVSALMTANEEERPVARSDTASFGASRWTRRSIRHGSAQQILPQARQPKPDRAAAGRGSHDGLCL